jgi:hypothetical protein
MELKLQVALFFKKKHFYMFQKIRDKKSWCR